MFSVDLNNYSIRMHAGDTGEVEYVISLEDETWGANDQVIWTMRNGRGEIVLQKLLTNNEGTVKMSFDATDTLELSAGTYRYDIRVLFGVTGLTEIQIADGGGFSFESVEDVATLSDAIAINILGPVGRIVHAQ